ncbi:MAG: DNA polymerase III subunit beta, partial [Lachnospiraceae bacterium]|nr:DNA polymerase III subunit beta [Lachnospiraceae bacterium]
ITESNLNIRMDSSFGSMSEDIDLEKEGKDMRRGFNPKFYIDALRVIDEETVTIYYINPKVPCFIKDENETYIYLVLPVNIL